MGISDVTWHTLLHSFASRLVNSGVDIVTVKELLGHSSICVTMRYARTNIESKRAAVEKIAGFGDNQPESTPIWGNTVTKSNSKLQCIKELRTEG